MNFFVCSSLKSPVHQGVGGRGWGGEEEGVKMGRRRWGGAWQEGGRRPGGACQEGGGGQSSLEKTKSKPPPTKEGGRGPGEFKFQVLHLVNRNWSHSNASSGCGQRSGSLPGSSSRNGRTAVAGPKRRRVPIVAVIVISIEIINLINIINQAKKDGAFYIQCSTSL